MFYEQWTSEDQGLEFRNVVLQCFDVPPTAFQPACAMVPVTSVDHIYAAGTQLQTPQVRLVLALREGIDFSDKAWPDSGLLVSSNVTLVAAANTTMVLDFGLKTTLFVVENSTSAFLSIRGFVLLNLPLAYLPPSHPRRAFGVLSTSLWPVYRCGVRRPW